LITFLSSSFKKKRTRKRNRLEKPTLVMSSPSHRSSQPAVLLALKALQDKVRRLETDRTSATSKAAQLRADLQNRESRGHAAREDFARSEIAAIEEGRHGLEAVVKERHELEISLVRKEERRRAAAMAVEKEAEKADEYRAEKMHVEGRMGMVAQRRRAMDAEVAQAKSNVEKLSAVYSAETNAGMHRISALTDKRDALRAALEEEQKLAAEAETKIVRTTDFLHNLMAINEALVNSAHAKRAAGLSHRDNTPQAMSPTHSQRMKQLAREEESIGRISKGTKKVKKKGKKQAAGRSSSAGKGAQRGVRRGQNRYGDENNYYEQPSRRSRPPPPPPPRNTIRTTNSSRLAASAASARLAMHNNGGKTQPLKDRIRTANLGPVPFLPAPHMHSFNVLAAVSEAVRTEVGDLEYKVHHHKGSISVVASPPRNKSPPRATPASVVQNGRSLAVTLPGVALGHMASPPRPPGVTRKAQQPPLPPELLGLLTSLEQEFDELNNNYVALLSTAKTGDGEIQMGSEESEKKLQELAESMARKEEQMKLFKFAQTTTAAAGTVVRGPAPVKKVVAGKQNPVRNLENLSPLKQRREDRIEC
jgi:hypothetical protein